MKIDEPEEEKPMRQHLNVFIPDALMAAIDEAAAERKLKRSAWVRWALGRILSEDEPYVYAPPTLPDWQVEAWTLLLRGLFGSEHLTITDEIRSLLRQAVEAMNERDARVLRRRFGLDGWRYTLEEAGDALGVERSRAHQIEAQALRRLRYWLRDSGIRELVKRQLEREMGD